MIVCASGSSLFPEIRDFQSLLLFLPFESTLTVPAVELEKTLNPRLGVTSDELEVLKNKID